MRSLHLLMILFLTYGCSTASNVNSNVDEFIWPMTYHILLEPVRQAGENRKTPNSLSEVINEFDRILPSEIKAGLMSAFSEERDMPIKSHDEISEIYLNKLVNAVMQLIPALSKGDKDAFHKLSVEKVAELTYLDFTNNLVERWKLDENSPLTSQFRNFGMASGQDILSVLFRIYGAHLNHVSVDVDVLIKSEVECR